MKKAIQLFVSTIFIFIAQQSASAATTFKLTKGKVQTITSTGKKYLCGSPTSKWIMRGSTTS